MQQLSAQQRYATLQVMGTRLWVPRVHLHGAATSQACAWPAPAKRLTARERLLQQPAVQPVPLPQAEHPPLAKTEDSIAQANLLVQPTQARVQPLHADIWLLANGWQLVMENLTGQPGLQTVEIKLLHNLLVALYPGGLGISGQQFFSWPLPGIPVEAGNEGELNMSLQAFLTGARFQGVQLAGCLVFGERLQGLMSKATHQLRVFPAPSLAELQQNPAAKQAFWQQAGSSGLRAAFASSPLVL